MNRIIRLSAVAALALITAGCGLRTRNFDDERAVTLNADCPDTLDLQVNLEYPVGRAPKEALEAMTESILSFVFDVDTVSGTVEETAGKYIEEVSSGYINDLSNAWEQHLADKDEWKDWIYNWYIHVSGSFSKGWRRYVNYFVGYEEYYGGAHGMYSLTPMVFDRKTGATVSESDLFKEGFEETLGGLLSKHLPEAFEGDDEAMDSVFDPQIMPNGSFEVTSKGITYYYQPYEIGPFYLGVISVTVPWKELEPILRK
jgi:hypothetical protein